MNGWSAGGRTTRCSGRGLRKRWSLAADLGVGPTTEMIDRVVMSLLAAGFFSTGGASGFARYPAAPRLQGTPARPKLVTKQARRFRTRLREEAAQGPNFNGHYRV